MKEQQLGTFWSRSVEMDCEDGYTGLWRDVGL